MLYLLQQMRVDLLVNELTSNSNKKHLFFFLEFRTVSSGYLALSVGGASMREENVFLVEIGSAVVDRSSEG